MTLNEPAGEPKPCPSCESDDVETACGLYREQYSGYCRDCGVRGPFADTIEKAKAAWNALPRHCLRPGSHHGSNRRKVKKGEVAR